MSNSENETTYTWQQFCKDFASLVWLDGTIDFAFRFVAKISEPLLAAGVVVSAVDYLTKGRLMHDNLFLANAWAWTQAVAIETSGGVVLLYALQSFREKDYLKAWLYVFLASLLAIVGGVMLFTQIASSTTNYDLAAHGPSWFVYSMAVLRSIVSIAYVIMCRTKRIRYNDLMEKKESVPSSPEPVIDIKSEIDHAVTLAIANAMQQVEQQLKDLQQRQFDLAIKEVKRTVIEEVTQQHLIAIPKEATSKTAKPSSKVVDSKPSNSDRLTIAKNALAANPTIKDKELADLLQCSSINTARNWKQKALAQLAAMNVEPVTATNGHHSLKE